jgi:hypothetical protein
VKVGDWCALSARRIVGPVFFNKTVNCERYVWVILGQFFSELTVEERLDGWFQQDSATVQTAHMSMQDLSAVFWDGIISSHIFPAHSHDLNPCDYFLLGLYEGQSLQQ